jgi:hypothetical protein
MLCPGQVLYQAGQGCIVQRRLPLVRAMKLEKWEPFRTKISKCQSHSQSATWRIGPQTLAGFSRSLLVCTTATKEKLKLENATTVALTKFLVRVTALCTQQMTSVYV